MATDWRKTKVPDAEALQAARDIQLLAVAQGFDWPSLAPMWDKLFEEIGEAQRAHAEGSHAELEDEIGDMLFMLVNIARASDVDPARALRRCVGKFIGRLAHMQTAAEARGERLEDLHLEQMEALWQAAKR